MTNLLMLSFLIALSGCGNGGPACASVDDASYSAYSALVDNPMFMGKGSAVVVEERTSFDSPPSGHFPVFPPATDFATTKQSFPALTQDTYDSFQVRNASTTVLLPRFSGTRPVTLLSKQDVDQFSWDAFNKRFPNAGGLNILSATGLNSACDQALVYVGNQVAPLQGAGFLILLAKTSQGWSIIAQRNLWIS